MPSDETGPRTPCVIFKKSEAREELRAAGLSCLAARDAGTAAAAGHCRRFSDLTLLSGRATSLGLRLNTSPSELHSIFMGWELQVE